MITARWIAVSFLFSIPALAGGTAPLPSARILQDPGECFSRER